MFSAYGLGTFISPPTISPNGGIVHGPATVVLADATPGAAIYYTTDGSTPSPSSSLYTNPLLLTDTTVLKVRAFKAGAIPSSVAFATFLNSTVIGHGTGLTASYYANQTGTFNGTPKVTRIDPTVNFILPNGWPPTGVGPNNFSVRWTGDVQAQFGETYTFYAVADDGVRVWVDNRLIIDAWFDQGPTEWSGSIALLPGHRYAIRMEFYQNGGGAQAQLFWSSPSTVKGLIPMSQLYPTHDLPPQIAVSQPGNGATFQANSASVPLSVTASDPDGSVSKVEYFSGPKLLASLTNSPFQFTWTKVAPGSYSLVARATDNAGVMTTSAPVSITVVGNAGLAYGITNRTPVAAYLGMPATATGAIPLLLSQTAAFADVPTLSPANGLIPYGVNTPFWSDGAVKTRWMAVPNQGSPFTPDTQIGFSTNGEWTFPGGTVFVKHFELITDETNPGVRRRLETRLLVRTGTGAVYGVTYKWRPDNSDADLLAGSLTEDIVITNATGVRTQTWYYPSPADCLTCHTPLSGYVLGVKTRQMNGDFTYPGSGRTDNQLRTLNQLGLFNSPIGNEADIPTYPRLSAVTDLSVSLDQRARSYIDANCAQCHRPGGARGNFDARYDTPLDAQKLINGTVVTDLGLDHARVVAPKDIWRSVLHQRLRTTDKTIAMPPLARSVVDQAAVSALGDWINSLPGVPALPPPSISSSGSPAQGYDVSLSDEHSGALVYYTLDGTIPTAQSAPYSSPFHLSAATTVKVIAAADGFGNSVSATEVFDFGTAPSLTVTTNGGQAVISWSITSTPFFLEQAASLRAPIQWTAVPDDPVRSGDTWSMSVDLTVAPGFFRLRSP